MSREIDSSHGLEPGLYVVATPIGNREDLSPRASRVLRAAQVVACEDTRTSRKLEPVAESSAKLVSLTEHNVEQRIEGLLAAAREGVVAIVSDAGTPGIADPGARLVAAAHEQGVPVRAIAGPSALSAALSVSGVGPGPTVFLGFLPRQAGERARLFEHLVRGGAASAVFFEAPSRIERTLQEIAGALFDPPVVVCRELTKLHEDVVRAPASEVFAMLRDPRGEYAVVIDLSLLPEPDATAEVAAYMAEMQRAGARRGAAASEAARRFGLSRSLAYGHWDESDDDESEPA